MDHKKIKGYTRVLGEDQGYLPLYVMDVEICDTVNGDGTPAMLTEYKPSPDDLKLLNEGGSLYIQMLGTTPNPLAVFVNQDSENFPDETDTIN